jgi:K+-transporting ATPase c subunit
MKHHSKIHGAAFSRNARLLAILMVVLMGVVAGAVLVISKYRPKLVTPDEKIVAAELLAKTFTGPRYFQIPPNETLDENGVRMENPATPFIGRDAARLQVERIARERSLGEAGIKKINGLIEEMTEAPSSRIVGDNHINLLRLNLALDTLN